jgi:hypothetical protein
LKLNKDLAEGERWYKEQIDKRTEKKVDEAVLLFRLQGDVV